ncbi:MAG: DUF4175 domain-containing protein [Rhodospirillales bacterium]
MLRIKMRQQILLWLARAVLVWEQLWIALWPFVAMVGIFSAIVLFDLLPMLPVWFHFLILIGFVAAFALSLKEAWSRIHYVSEEAARHRLEIDSGFKHRPLTALEDRLLGAENDANAQRLWALHLERMAAATRALKVRIPSPGLPKRDPLALRAVVLFMIIIAFSVGHRDAAARFERALLPSFERVSDVDLDISVWLTPPAYTGKAPVFVKWQPNTESSVIRIPEGTTLLAQVAGVRSAPKLKIGDQINDFASIDPKQPKKGHRVEATVESGDRLAVEISGRERAVWPLDIIADQKPIIKFDGKPQGTTSFQLQVPFIAEDDYGISEIRLHVRRADGKTAGGPPPGGLEGVLLPTAGIGKKNIKSTNLQDLTSHPWAGLLVKLQLSAQDGRKQEGRSKFFEMELPERLFTHPVAKEIIEQRKKLVAGTDDVRGDVSTALDVISGRPWRFRDDTTVYLALRVSSSRLLHDQSAASIFSVQKMLWDTALRLEDGNYSLAEKDLQKAQEALLKALQRGAPKEEIERLMGELKKALENYLAAVRDMIRQHGAAKIPLVSAVIMLGGDELRRLLRDAQELARTGAMSAARQMLSQLQRMLQGLRSGLRFGKSAKNARQAQKLMKGLNEITKKQQQLLDQTFRFLRDGPELGQTGKWKKAKQNAKEQTSVRRKLGGLMLKFDKLMGGIPKNFGHAEQAMGQAAKALNLQRPGAAFPSQTQAVEQLRRATDSMTQRVARQMGVLLGVPLAGIRKGMPGPNDDPFGRSMGEGFGNADEEEDIIPDKVETRKAYEILRELRRRAGQRQRPTEEREYIERLLRQF